jgi:hypothetical protein
MLSMSVSCFVLRVQAWLAWSRGLAAVNRWDEPGVVEVIALLGAEK